jgi:2-iminobutanoate/2-iminopropanoate deaminase
VCMKIEKITTSQAPEAVGPYSQGIIAGGFIFVSGQIPIDPDTGNMVDGGIREQTIRVLHNLEAVLQAKSLMLNAVIKVEVFLAKMDHFKDMNEIYASKFNTDPLPARQVIGVAGLPMNALVEISCIACLTRSSRSVKRTI